MKLLRISKDKYSKSGKGGFTLIEVVVVMTIIVIFGGLGLFYGLDNLWGHSFRSDRDTLVSALQHARAEAIANICRGPSCDDDPLHCCKDGLPHGVYIDQANKKFIIFQGENYEENNSYNLSLEAKYNIGYSGVREIVFEQLSGNASALGSDPWNIILTDNVTTKNSTITINKEGQIIWTN